jgi:hypothetical protein
VNDEIAHVHPQAEWDGVDLTQLDLASRRLFERLDHASPHHLLKGIGSDVPPQQSQSNNTEEAEQPK